MEPQEQMGCALMPEQRMKYVEDYAECADPLQRLLQHVQKLHLDTR